MMHVPSRINWEYKGGAIPESEGTSTAWMLTFADLVSLMLTFFVLLFAMSGTRPEQWQEMVSALSRRLNPPLAVQEPMPGSAMRNIRNFEEQPAAELTYLASLFETVVADTPNLKGVRVKLEEGRLVVSLPADEVFVRNGTAVAPAGKTVLASLVGPLNGLTNQIAVAVHTSPMKEGGPGFPSNWEFSLQRAVMVADALHDVGVGQTIPAYGMADGQFDALPEVPPAERMVLSRRVDLVILPSWRRSP